MSSAATIERTTHPVADLFPMLPDDELEELAADIAERGLLQPIVLDAEGRILDGRNRLVACERVGVAPQFTTYDGDDPDGYALAVNIARRHLNKGQIAMVAARAHAVCDKPLSRVARENDVSKSRIVYAKTVLDHAPDLADSVVSCAMSLDVAYRTAQERKKAAAEDEQSLTRLQDDAPDLADQVVDGDLTVSQAITALSARMREKAERQRDARTLLRRAVELLAPDSMSDEFLDDWALHLGSDDDDLTGLMARAVEARQVLDTLIGRRSS